MKILAISFFDPASVVLSHRDLMRAAGHDFRLACVRAYTDHQLQVDWLLERSDVYDGSWDTRPYVIGNSQELFDFAQGADVIQLHPGIGTGGNGWETSSTRVSPHHELDGLIQRFGIGTVSGHRQAAKVAFFHGSVAAWEYRNTFRSFYQDTGFGLAASTIDYATELEAAYLPPFVDVGDRRAPIRGPNDPMLIAHTPSDPVACQTKEFLRLTKRLGLLTRTNPKWIDHDKVMALKIQCNAGFDHMRGSFSVNTLENAALGLVPLVGLKREYRERGGFENVPWNGIRPFSGGHSDIQTFSDLDAVLRRLDADPELHAQLQYESRHWYGRYFSASAITYRLLDFYTRLA